MELPQNPFVICVDEQNNPLGVTLKEIAHQKGILHRAFSIFLLRKNSNGILETLIQQRNPAKYHSGGLWSNSCCSHPQPYKDITEELHNRIQFELGITEPIKYTSAGTFIYKSTYANSMIEHELDEVFFGFYGKDTIPSAYNKEEIAALDWIEIDQLDKDVNIHPDRYTSWLPFCIKQLNNNVACTKKRKNIRI